MRHLLLATVRIVGRIALRDRRPARERLISHLPYLSGVALLTLFAGLSLFQFKEMSGHDTLEYLPRSVEFWEGLGAGQLFPRWAPDLSSGYGQPLFNFSPPLFYYASSVFHLLGFSFVASQDLACFALLLLAGLGMYVLAREFSGSQGGLVSVAAYLFAPYLLGALYVRHALADFSALAFIPLAFWGIYRLSVGGRYRFMIISAAVVALLLLSSNTVALITIPALLLFAGWLAYGKRSWRTFCRGLGGVGLGLGLSAFFWLPALVERDFVHVERLVEGYTDYRNHFVYLRQFFFSPWGYGVSVPGPVDGMSFAVGPVHLLLVAAALLLLWRTHRAADQAQGALLVSFFLVLFFGAIFFASNASLFIWQRLSLLQYLQFPWRFLSLVAASTAFLCGFPFLFLRSRDKRLVNGLMGGMIVMLFLLGFPHARPEKFLDVKDADFSPRNIAVRDIAVTTTGEYEPVWVKERPPFVEERLAFIEGSGRVSVTRAAPTHFEFRVVVAEQARLRMHTFYFPGWTLSVNGADRPIDYSNPYGIMEFSLEPGDHLVEFNFADTPIRSLASLFSWLALLSLAFTPGILAAISRLRRRANSGSSNHGRHT